jgi:hypothetical protein
MVSKKVGSFRSSKNRASSIRFGPRTLLPMRNSIGQVSGKPASNDRYPFARRTMLKQNLLTYEELRRRFYYDPETGIFTRLGSKRKVGCVNMAGYLTIFVRIRGNKRSYGAHRLAWFYVFGRWPKNEIDHRNNNRLDNRIANLREATTQQNRTNKLTKNEARGAYWHKRCKRWQALITVNYRKHHLGYFKTRIEAAAAYDKAARAAFGEFANGGH